MWQGSEADGAPLTAKDIHFTFKSTMDVRTAAAPGEPDRRGPIRSVMSAIRELVEEDADLDDAWWVIAAAPPDVNRQVQEAAELIKSGLVKVNGEIDERRGRQLHHGDTVTVNGRTVRISTPEGA